MSRNQFYFIISGLKFITHESPDDNLESSCISVATSRYGNCRKLLRCWIQMGKSGHVRLVSRGSRCKFQDVVAVPEKRSYSHNTRRELSLLDCEAGCLPKCHATWFGG
jgi:hypothetical protein